MANLLRKVSGFNCPFVGRGARLILNGTNPATWTLYRFNFTATASTLWITFGFRIENNSAYYLDEVSVVDQNVPSVELLENPNFENSSMTPQRWLLFCSMTCLGTQGTIVNGTSYYSSSGYCFKDGCAAPNATEFLSQSLAVVVSHIYAVSFWLIQIGGGLSLANTFSVNIS